MTTAESIARELCFETVCEGDNFLREVSEVYCCDLLSITMGRAPAGSAWVTVMANINAVAVAVLCDISCIVVAEGMAVDEAFTAKAEQQGVTVLRTELPVFAAAKEIDGCVSCEA